MIEDTFRKMNKFTPDNFQFSIKVPEVVTHDKRLDVENRAITDLEEFLAKISPLKTSDKLGALLIQLAPSFTVKEFINTEKLLDRLPRGYDYAMNLEILHGILKAQSY